MRLFVGIPLTDAVIEQLSAISMRLRSQADGLRWSAPESWHITLQFLGSTQQYECIVSRLRELRLPTVPIQLEELGFFERAGVFFAGVNLTPELEALQQRVTVARALAGRPRVVWADEPTGALDSETAEQVMQLLRELNADGLTLIVVTHDESVGASANRAIKMRDGRIVSDELVGGAVGAAIAATPAPTA